MPLSINVGLSKKASRDYQSTGTSINIVAELDATFLAKPDELQRQINNLYEQARQAINRQAAGVAEAERPAPPSRETTRPAGRTHGRPAGTRNNNGGGDGRGYGGGATGTGNGGRGGGVGGGNGPGPMTESQRRAINAIATRLGVDPHLEARDVAGAELGQLSIRQASELIDHLKAQQEQPAGNGR